MSGLDAGSSSGGAGSTEPTNSNVLVDVPQHDEDDKNDVGLVRNEMPDVHANQFRALALKTLSYEKHTCCTTCCCVFMCPFLMVLLCGILSVVVKVLLQHISPDMDVQFCSNVSASDPFTNIPLANAPQDSTGRYFFNFDQSTTVSNACVNWFGEDYPYSLPYSPELIDTDNCSTYTFYNPDICPYETTSFLPAPAASWTPKIGTTAATQNDTIIWAEVVSYSISVQNNIWGWYLNTPTNLGANSPVKNEIPLVTYGAQDSFNFTSAGILGGFTTMHYIDPNTFNLTSLMANPSAAAFEDIKVEKRPYFLEQQGNATTLDDGFNTLLNSIVGQLNNVQKPSSQLSNDDPLVLNYTATIAQILSTLPYGAIFVDEIPPTGNAGVFSYTIQAGTNQKLAYTSVETSTDGGSSAIPPSAFPSEGLRRIYFHSQLVQQFIKNFNATIVQGLRILPTNMTTGLSSFPIGSMIGQILYPFGVSFLFPIFLLNLVKDKEDRILVMMKMNGLKVPVYWLSEYIHFYSLHIISTIVFIITGFIFKLQFFTLTSPGVYLLLFFLWGHVQILLAFLFSSLFQRSRYALLVGFLLVVIGVIINIATTGLYTTEPAPLAYYIWPPFAFYRAIGLINSASFTLGQASYNFSMIKPGDEVYSCIAALVIAIVIVFFLAVYLFEVLPSEFGVRKPWHYPVTYTYAYFRNLLSEESKLQKTKAHVASNFFNTDNIKRNEEDDDVVAERERVFGKNYPENTALLLRNMKKSYGQKNAVKGVSLAIEPGIVFGLLGPNGAGKTTLISILTGLYEASGGDGYLAGFKVGEEMDSVYRSMGVCPQHDILWPELTVEEHLLFYARLKGVSRKNEKGAVDDALARVSLTKFRDRASTGLSGGEKRRLSIAIALIGNGQVIFLDEPTTGLDPEVRRLIWNIINEQRAGKTIVLTTHSMEEAEVLCQRIGIMAKGTLRCIGPQLHLKNKYGSGFRVVIMCNPADAPKATAYIESLLPAGYHRIDSFAGNFSYDFPAAENAVARIFDSLSQHSGENGIVDWGLSQTSLEEVFLRIIGEADAMADS